MQLRTHTFEHITPTERQTDQFNITQHNVRYKLRSEYAPQRAKLVYEGTIKPGMKCT